MFNLKNPVSTLKIIALCLHPLMLCPEHGSVTDTPNVFGLQTTYKWRSSEVSLIFMDSKGKIIWHLIKTIWTVLEGQIPNLIDNLAESSLHLLLLIHNELHGQFHSTKLSRPKTPILCF